MIISRFQAFLRASLWQPPILTAPTACNTPLPSALVAVHLYISDDVLSLIIEELSQPVDFQCVFPNFSLHSDGRRAVLAMGLTCRRWADLALPVLRRAAYSSYFNSYESCSALTALAMDISWISSTSNMRSILSSTRNLRYLEFLFWPETVPNDEEHTSAMQSVAASLEAALSELQHLKHLNLTFSQATVSGPVTAAIPRAYEGHLYLCAAGSFEVPANISGLTVQALPPISLCATLREGPVLPRLTRLCLEGGDPDYTSLFGALAEKAPNLREAWLHQPFAPSAVRRYGLRALLSLPQLETFAGLFVARGSGPIALGPKLRHLHIHGGDGSTIDWLADLRTDIGQLDTLVFYETDQHSWYPGLPKSERKRLGSRFTDLSDAANAAGVKLWKGPLGGRKCSPFDRWQNREVGSAEVESRRRDSAYNAFLRGRIPSEC